MAFRQPYLWWLLVVCFCLAAVQCAFAWPTVRKGNRGPNVVVVQDLLPSFHYPSNGHFNGKTEAAVKKFQSSKGIQATGIVDAITWAPLVRTITGGTGKAVHAIQYLLVHRFRLLSGEDITSVYSEKTKAAVKKFQALYGLPQSGHVHRATWKALLTRTPKTSSQNLVTPAQQPPCSNVTMSRAGIVALAKWTVGKRIMYTQKSPWYEFHGILHKTCPPQVPQYADAYSFVAWLFWTGYGNGPDFVRNCNWSDCSAIVMTNTTGREVPLAQAKPGDVVIFWTVRGYPHMHAAFYIGNNEVVTMGYYYQDRMWSRTVLIRNLDWWKQNGHYVPGYTIRTYDEVV